MKAANKVTLVLHEYTRDDLMKMEPVVLRSLLHERTHHNIEVSLYPTLLRGGDRNIPGFGEQAKLVFDVWRERGLPEDAPDIEWVKTYLALAEKVRAGEKVTLKQSLPKPFTKRDMTVVNRLIYERRSTRNWTGEPVPDEMIEEILEAGRAAPNSCNLNHLRFIVLREPEEKKMIWSDLSTQKASAIIVICHDKRVPEAVGHSILSPQNAGFDAAAAADHMLLMASALGLGACWLTSQKASAKTKDTAQIFKQKYGLPDYIEVDLHIAIGWPAIGTIKTSRMSLKDMMLGRSKGK